jgi:hypothetical protein
MKHLKSNIATWGLQVYVKYCIYLTKICAYVLRNYIFVCMYIELKSIFRIFLYRVFFYILYVQCLLNLPSVILRERSETMLR